MALPGIREAALLCTCNRVEVYAVAVGRAGGAARAAAATWRGARRARRAELEPHLYVRSDAEAVHHLFRVASSLDSLVIGEPQILGQVKHAHDAAAAVGDRGADPEPVLLARVPRRAAGAARDRDRAQPGVGELGGDRSRAPGLRRLRGAARS